VPAQLPGATSASSTTTLADVDRSGAPARGAGRRDDEGTQGKSRASGARLAAPEREVDVQHRGTLNRAVSRW
jgi:hypothetical protein